MTHRSPARYLAPLALVGFAVALLIVVGGSSRSDEVPATPSTTVERTSRADAAQQNAAKKKRKKAATRTYVVEAGDTPSGIAEKTGVPLETIEQLNPDLDPEGLNVGDEITLR